MGPADAQVKARRRLPSAASNRRPSELRTAMLSSAGGPMTREQRPSWANVVTNWQRRDLTFAQKLRLQLKNSWLRVRRVSNCCGNPGEPGC